MNEKNQNELTFSDGTILHLNVLKSHPEWVGKTVEALSSHCREVNVTFICTLSQEMRELFSQWNLDWLMNNAGINPE